MPFINPVLSIASAVLSTIFLVTGTVGNIYLFCKHIKKPFSSDPTFIFLGFLRLTDAISLYEWNLKHILVPFFNIDNERISLLSCKLSSFFQFFSLKLSAWILVAIMFERYFSINVRNWRQLHINKIKTLSVAFLLVFIISIIEMPITVINGYVETVNGSRSVVCYDSKQFPFIPVWQQIHSFLYSFIPCFLILIVWILLLFVWVRRRTIRTDDYSKSTIKLHFDSITKRLIIVSIAFTIASLPSSIFGLYYGTLSKSSFGLNLMLTVDILMFAYHGLNFLTFAFIHKETIDQIGFTNF